MPVVVTLNAFVSDTQAELDYIQKFCEDKGCEFALAKVWEKVEKVELSLQKKFLRHLRQRRAISTACMKQTSRLKQRLRQLLKKYTAQEVLIIHQQTNKQIAQLEQLGFGNLPICMAKTQYSLSDDPTLLGRPEGFEMNVREAYVSAGAGFIVVLTGSVMTMPGLSKSPAAYNIDVNDDGVITGLF